MEVVGLLVAANTEAYQIPFFVNTALTLEFDVMYMYRPIAATPSTDPVSLLDGIT